MTHTGDRNPMFRPITMAEDTIIRDLADQGLSPKEMSAEMRQRGYPRKRDTIRLYMRQRGIEVNAALYKARRAGRPRAAPARLTFIADYVYISPQEANAAFAEAWGTVHQGRRYQDHAAASRGKDALTMKRPYAVHAMTTGGVAVYG